MNSSAQSELINNGEFLLRDALPEDRDAVVAFTADTWEGGDYIHWVYDDWVRDELGRFLVAVEVSSGQIAAIDKLSFLAPGEAWFEGIRVNPAYRGRGLAAAMQRHLIEEARSMGARTVRFITNVIPSPIQRIAYRDGFSQRFVARNWIWSRENDSPRSGLPEIRLRSARPSEAAALHAWWSRSASCYATDGLVDKGWSFGSTTSEEWETAAEEERLFVREEARIDDLALPPPTALVLNHKDEQGSPEWHLSAISCAGSEWDALAAALVDRARSAKVTRLQGLFPDMAQVHEAVLRAGFQDDPHYARFVLFELVV